MTFGGLRSDNLPSDDYEEKDDRWYMHDSVIDTGRAERVLVSEDAQKWMMLCSATSLATVYCKQEIYIYIFGHSYIKHAFSARLEALKYCQT